MSLNQVPVKRKKARWYDKNIEIMLKVCIEEVNAVNKPHNHFTKLGWANMQKSSIRHQTFQASIAPTAQHNHQNMLKNILVPGGWLLVERRYGEG